MNQYNQQPQYQQSPYQQPQYQQVSYQQSQYQQASYQQPLYQQSNLTYGRDIILSIIQIIFIPLLYGLIPLIITITANNAWKSGDYEAYTRKTNIAGKFLLVGWIFLGIEAIVVIGGIIYYFYWMVSSGF